MYFKSGTINAKTCGTGDNAHNSSAGIGAGGGNGGSTYMEFSGATVYAYGSYHGSGVGAGWSSGDTGHQHGWVNNNRPNVCGDITITDGYVYSRGYAHGAAFGGACGTTAAGCTIRVTGGTLLPVSTSGRYDFNGTSGTVYITGGSVRSASTSKFMSSAGQGVAYDAKKGTVFMTTINLAAEGIEDDIIDSATWEMSIGGVVYDYGSPYSFDEGKLYLWVPESAKGQKISVTCSYTDKNGVYHTLDPLYIENADGGGGSVLKRYVTFAFPEEYTDNLRKDYDGTNFADFSLAENKLTASDGKTLDSDDSVELFTQLYSGVDGEPIEEEQSAEQMPADAGTYLFTMISKQYANDSGFKDSYWGHKATGWAVINKIDSKLTATYSATKTTDEKGKDRIDSVTVTANVSPHDDAPSTCAVPDGYLQFYINGVKVGSPVDLSQNLAAASLGRAAVGNTNVVTQTFSFENGTNYAKIPELNSGEFTVTAKYTDGTNYYDNFTEAELLVDPEDENAADEDDILDSFPYVNPPIPAVTPPENEEEPGDEDDPAENTPLELVKVENIEQEDVDPDQWPLHGWYEDFTSEYVKESETGDLSYFVNLINSRYVFTDRNGSLLESSPEVPLKATDHDVKVFTVLDGEENEVDFSRATVDLSKSGAYMIVTEVTDSQGNVATISLAYSLYTYDDNDVDTDDDGKPDLNVDTDGDGKPDVNIDTDNDGIPDINIDTDGDDKPDINIDTDGDDKPDINIVDKDGDGEPDDLDEPLKNWPKIDDTVPDELKPDVNVDTDDDGKPDVNIDTDDDGKPDVNVDTDDDGKPDVNIDTDDDGIPDINIDTDGDDKPDINIDTDGDDEPDINIVDKDGDGEPDDLDEPLKNWPKIDDTVPDELKPDVNVDTNDDGKPDTNIDTDDDNKPDINIDTNDDGKPDINIDTNDDGKPDVNIVDKDGDGKPDDLDEYLKDWPKLGDKAADALKPNVNVDIDGDGKPDLNVDTNGDGKPDVNIDADGDGIVDDTGTGKAVKDEKTVKPVKTDDTSNLALWFCTMLISAAVMGVLLIQQQRRKRYEK